MKYLILLFLMFFVSSCTSKTVMLKPGTVYTIKPPSFNKRVISFSVPHGNWTISKVTLKTGDRGWFTIHGGPPEASIKYSIKFAIEEQKNYGEDMREVLKTQNFDKFLADSLNEMRPERLKEMGAINGGGKIIKINSFKCKNTWYQQGVRLESNQISGLATYTSHTTCPLVVDGEILVFGYTAIGSIIEKYPEKQSSNGGKSDSLSDKQILATLSDQVLSMFNDIKFQGIVSQNYNDIAGM